MYRSILVPLDGSLPSEQALPYAATLARRSGASVELVYVHTPLLLAEGALYLGTPDVQLWEEEKQYLLTVVERLKKSGVEKAEAHLLEGPVVEKLQEHAFAQGCDLTVMTTHGRGPMSRFWLGSVANQLLTRTTIPILLIRAKEEAAELTKEPELRDILVALDGTASSEQILEPATTLAKVMGSSCTLLRVTPAVSMNHRFEKSTVDAALADKLRAEAHVYLQRIAASLHDRGIATRTRILAHSYPAAAILTESSSGSYGAVALETHGRCGLPRLFLGSVADKVVRGASLPVLVHRCLPS
jgi:nucleotide-binding universal stress UspA family protein